jgi:hypothetical protein
MKLTSASFAPASGILVALAMIIGCSRTQELPSAASNTRGSDISGPIEAGPEAAEQVIEKAPKTCAAECPIANPICKSGLTTGIGFPGCNATESLLYQHSPACLSCALNASCLHDNQGDQPPKAIDCEDVKGNDKVDAASTRAQACLNLLSCELTTKCGAGGVTDCYCGAGVNSLICTTSQTGSCVRPMQFALESTDPTFIQSKITATASGNGGSVANALVHCLHNNCSTACF